MRKMMCLFSIVAALSGGCSDDDTDDSENPSTGNSTGGTSGGTGATSGGSSAGNTGSSTTGGTTGGSTGTSSNGTTGSDADGGAFVCPRERIPATLETFKGTVTMTMAGYTACQQKCMNDQACYTEANCPGIDAFNECMSMNLFACTAAAGGTCRKQYEDAVCCVTEAQCPASDATCPATKCPDEVTAFEACGTADDACLQKAGPSCLAAGRVSDGASLSTPALPRSGTVVLRALQALQH